MSSATVALVKPPIPAFEGAAVESATVQITGTCTVDADNDVLVSIDDRVRLVGEYRVVGVQFVVDPKTGDTVRKQVLKPIAIQLCPWDPNDPTDDGIVRARPQGATP